MQYKNNVTKITFQYISKIKNILSSLFILGGPFWFHLFISQFLQLDIDDQKNLYL